MLADTLTLAVLAGIVYLVVRLRAVKGYSEAVRPETHGKWLADYREKRAKTKAQVKPSR